MTFNIRNSRALEDQQDHNWNDRKNKVVKIIDKYQPSIVGFQEVLHDQMRHLTEELGNRYSYYGIGRDDGKHKGEYNPIFYKKELKKIDMGTFWLSDTPAIPSKTWPGCCFRTCSFIHLAITDDLEIIVANTHLDEKYVDTRMKSIDVLTKLNDLKTQNLIVMGDFNFEITSLEYKNLVKKLSLKNSFKEVNGNYDESLVTYHGYTGERTAPTKRLIDFIFYKGETLKVIKSSILYDNPGDTYLSYPSDHWPVLTEFILD